MTEPLIVDLFAEDRAHEEWLRPLLLRLARDEGREISIRVRSARGGHGRALQELKLYQRSITSQAGIRLPDLVVAAIDANCASFAGAQQQVESELLDELRDRTIMATPDPHIERWFLADLEAFHRVVGITPSMKSDKCQRDYYKNVLAQAIVAAGHPPTLGGLEFAQDLVAEMDFFRAGKSDNSLKHFLEDVRSRFQFKKSRPSRGRRKS